MFQLVEVQPRKRGSARPGSECCALSGDVQSEAYTAIVRGGILSRENYKVVGAEAFANAEGNMCDAGMRGVDALPRSKTPSRTKGMRRNLGGLTFDRERGTATGPHGEGEEP